MPVDYSTGKIYRLACNEDPSLCYYGSTTQPLSKRLHSHKADYKCWTEGKGHYVSSFEMCKHPSVIIVLVENVLAADKTELAARERWWIENNQCVNKAVPGRTDAERYSANRGAVLAKKAEYYAANRERFAEYREINREVIKERNTEYRSANREAIKERNTEYRSANREAIKTKITCMCGSIVSRNNKAAHERSNKHQATLAGTSTA